jgi:hypothetical protein
MQTPPTLLGVAPPAAPRVFPPPGTPPTPPMPPRPTATEDGAGPLDEGHMAAIRLAIARRKPITRAGRIARTSAITTLVIAACALPCLLLSPSLSGLIVTAGLAVTGVIEYKASRQMCQARPGAARVLGRNQLCLLGVIILYCGMQMATFSTEDARNAALSPEARSQLTATPDMQQSIDTIIEKWAAVFTYGFYGVVIFTSALCQGGLAFYYFTRRRSVEQFNASTSPWIRRLLAEIAP